MAISPFNKDREMLRTLRFIEFLEESKMGKGILSILRESLTGNPQDRSSDDLILFLQPSEMLRHVLMAWGFPGIEPEELMKVMDVIKGGFYRSLRGITSIKVVSEDEELIISNLGKWSISPDGELTVILEDGRTETERKRKTSGDVVFGKNVEVHLEGGEKIKGAMEQAKESIWDSILKPPIPNPPEKTDMKLYGGWHPDDPDPSEADPGPFEGIHPGNIEEVSLVHGEIFIRYRADHDLVEGGTTKLIGPIHPNDLPPWMNFNNFFRDEGNEVVDITAHSDETHRWLNPRTGETFGGSDP